METERIKVVVRYANGRVLKGYTQDFYPNKDRFHLFPTDQPGALGVEVLVKDLKALFLVRDFAGDPHYVERKKYREAIDAFDRTIELSPSFHVKAYEKKQQAKVALSVLQ